ncbi:uncharacterized protein RSE6_06077 [Rhynchosporium secalis]|uniref:Uncharacterized protein n=1 Tax=Rhynchosporium secalis TaxID=38038 RepID=A0A1E1M9G2_RHYSE|nr:uncharacterized protein RSE6_06077 [Rhynchosporium secalis]
MDKLEVSYQVGVTSVAVDTIALIITNLLVPDDGTKHPGTLIASTLREWMAIARRHHEKLEGGLSESDFKEMFSRVIVNDRVRNGELWAIRQPDDNDLSDIEGFVETGEWDVNGEDVWNSYVCNQTFFVTKSGMMGMGHVESEIGDEVWVFDGGKMPFCLRLRHAESPDDFDFVGCCYAYEMMCGEAYEGTRAVQSRGGKHRKRVIRGTRVGPGVRRRTVRLH